MLKHSLLATALTGIMLCSHGARVFYQSEEAARSYQIPVTADQVGHTATFLGCAQRFNDNYLHIVIYLTDPEGTRLGQTILDTKVTASISLIKTTQLIEGNYVLAETGNGDDPTRGEMVMATAIDWDAPGDDIGNLQEEWNQMLDDLKDELSGELDSRTAELQGKITELQKQLNDAISKHDADQAAILKKIEEFQKEISTLETELKARIAELEKAKGELQAEQDQLRADHEKDIAALNARINELDSKFGAEISKIQNMITQLTQNMEQLEDRFSATDEELKDKIEQLEKEQQEIRQEIAEGNPELNARLDTLEKQQQELENRLDEETEALRSEISELSKQQNQLRQELELAKIRHDSDIASIRSRIDSETAALKAAHEADIKLLEQSISNLDSKYAAESGRLSSELERTNDRLAELEKAYAAGNKELESEINALKLDQLSLSNRIANLEATHSRDVSSLQSQINEKNAVLNDKIDSAVADLRQEQLAAENRYREQVRELNDRLAGLEAKLDAKVDRLSDADRELYKEIAALREKLAGHQAELEAVKAAHERDIAALEEQYRELDAEYQADKAELDSRIADIETDIVGLREKHEADIAAIHTEINEAAQGLNEEIKTLYQELAAQKEAMENHKQEVVQAIDRIQQQIALLDAAINERLTNLENRIRYSVYSDEKLAELKKAYEQKVREKEAEIATLDIEIRKQQEAGQDVALLVEQRNQALTELEKLRNELKDIEFAIVIRNDESEFAVHEAEILQLKKELAALRNSTDALIKDLQQQLIDTEKKLLALIEEIKAGAAGENQELRQELEVFKEQVLELIESLQAGQTGGDDALKQLIEELDASHKELLAKLEQQFADRLEELKVQQDKQYDNLRTTISDLALQQRYSNGGFYERNSYQLPNIESEGVPADNRDLRVSPDKTLEMENF